MTERSLLIRSLPCIACEIWGVSQPFPTEAHHTLRAGLRRGDEFQLPLCEWSHRGRLLPAHNVERMTSRFGPSLARGSKPFHAVFGTDDELLAKVNKKLNP